MSTFALIFSHNSLITVSNKDSIQLKENDPKTIHFSNNWNGTVARDDLADISFDWSLFLHTWTFERHLIMDKF